MDNYTFSNAAGRYIVLCFFASAGDMPGRRALAAVTAGRAVFDDRHASLFGVTIDPADEHRDMVKTSVPGIRFFYDFDLSVSRLYGVADAQAVAGRTRGHTRMWVILDPMLRVLRVVPFADDGSDAANVLAFVAGLPSPGLFAGIERQAPVLLLDNVFEPELCRLLIDGYDAAGGEESGFMREQDGRTVLVSDVRHKRRKDHLVTDPALLQQVRDRIRARIVPEIEKVFQFKVTRMERYLVGCYAAADGGHFSAHRDNTTRGTAHRRFAVSINLNATFKGGQVSFPEFGPRGYKPPPGAAVVFSCSLLHAVSRVIEGQRFAFLPFLYDDAAAAIRERNAAFVDG